jgi:DNA-binding transcriptional ArsR family regulator
MSGIFPIRRQVELEENRGARLVDIEEDVADDVFDALSSRTTRRIFRTLHDSPQAASDLAEATGTSLQNVEYHLQKLLDVELIEVADTWYSERGTEMTVYAPTDDALVLFAGRDKRGTLESLLKRIAGMGGVLLPVSAMVGWLVRSGLGGSTAERTGAQGAPTAADATYEAASGPTGAGMDPALLAGTAFLLGGVFVLALVAATWYWRP